MKTVVIAENRDDSTIEEEAENLQESKIEKQTKVSPKREHEYHKDCDDQDESGLRRVPGRIPAAVWLVSLASMCERFAYYAFLGPLQNYVQNRRGDPVRPGALGLGESKASMLVTIFLLISYVTPTLAAVVSDNYLGKFRTISISLVLYIVGIVVLLITSIPSLLARGSGIPGFVISILIVSMGTSGVKAALPPFLAEQCGAGKNEIKTTKKGERYVVDSDATREYAFNIYYWCVNIGAQSRIPATFIEKSVGFWLTFLMSAVSLVLSLLVFVGGKSMYLKEERQPSMLPKARQAFTIAARHGFKMDAAIPANTLERDHKTVPWNNGFIEELKIGLVACRAFIPFSIFILCQNQMSTNTVSQAGEMRTHGVPNDLLPNVNSITVIILMPIITHVLYPLLRRWNIAFPPITRIAVGFAFESLGMGYAAGIQGWIYSSGPCYTHPLACPASKNGTIANNVHIATQIPVYVLEGLSESFAFPASYEYAYTKAPKSMKSVLQSVLSLSFAAAAIIGLALSPTYHDPYLLAMYASLAGVMLLTTLIFIAVFWKYNKLEAGIRH
ncbi:hypothetical protein AAFC00_006501 [Neodothiora populina]|uniref:Oligopeptide transporter n=1 Tax=Neodothiora populina TaxID=2781224 RepID=A0ABR3P6R7_9PEZI